MWQPIETAPKDGTVILLPGDVPARWRSGLWELLEPKPEAEGLSPTHWKRIDLDA